MINKKIKNNFKEMNNLKNIKNYFYVAGMMAIFLFSAVFVYAANMNLQELREKAQMRAEESRERIQEIRNQVQDKMNQMRGGLMEKIRQIGDEDKQEAAEKIVSQINHINQVWTDHFINVLDRLDLVLQKIKSRADKAKSNGKDVSLAESTILDAENKITAAREAVTLQAGKVYSVDTTKLVGTEPTNVRKDSLTSSFREQFQNLRSQLFSDLKSLGSGAMKDARNSVQGAFRALSQVPNVDEEPAENSGN